MRDVPKRVRALSELLMAVRFSRGLGYLADPRFWTGRSMGQGGAPAFQRRRDAVAFRADMLSQVLLDRPFLQDRWRAAIRSAPRPAREPEPLPVVGPEEGADIARLRGEMRPFVIRGGIPGFEAWDFEAFVGQYAEQRVLLSCPVFDGYTGTVRELDVPGVYLHNSEVLLSRFPELLEAAGFAAVAELARPLAFAGVVQLFAGRAGTGAWWHCANGYNHFVQLCGRKRWTFLHPDDTPRIFPRTGGRARGTYYWSDVGPTATAFQEAAALTSGSAASLDPWMVEAYQSSRRWTMVIEPGDILVNPPFFWHQVENLDPATIGMATRWFDWKNRVFSVDVFNAGECLRPSVIREMAQSVLGQTLVSKAGVDFAAWRQDLERGVLEERTRGRQADYLDVEPDVAAYYASKGFRR